MNNRNKGNRQELKCEEELTHQGWLVQRCGYRRFQQNDFYGLWDCMAIQPGKTLFVQVKSNRKPKLKEYKQFLEIFPQFTGEIWIWQDNKGWKIITHQEIMKYKTRGREQ